MQTDWFSTQRSATNCRKSISKKVLYLQPEVKKELEMRSTFKILFYANKGKEKDGIVPIMGRITINGTQCQFSCKHSIPLAMWDVKGNCAKGRSKEALQINRDLDNIKAQIIKRYQHLSDHEAFVTAEMVRRSALATLCLQRTPIRDSAVSMRPC